MDCVIYISFQGGGGEGKQVDCVIYISFQGGGEGGLDVWGIMTRYFFCLFFFFVFFSKPAGRQVGRRNSFNDFDWGFFGVISYIFVASYEKFLSRVRSFMTQKSSVSVLFFVFERFI